MQYQPALHFSSGASPAETRKLPLCPVLGLPLVSAEAETVIRTLLSPGRRTVFFLNAHCANIRASNASYAAALARADYVLPDGIGVELAALAHLAGAAMSAQVERFDAALAGMVLSEAEAARAAEIRGAIAAGWRAPDAACATPSGSCDGQEEQEGRAR